MWNYVFAREKWFAVIAMHSRPDQGRGWCVTDEISIIWLCTFHPMRIKWRKFHLKHSINKWSIRSFMSFPFAGFFAPRLAFRRACEMWGLFIGRCISICYMRKMLYSESCTQHRIHTNTHAHRLPKLAASKNIRYGNENDRHTQHTESVSVESISGGNISLMLSMMRSSVASDVCTLGFLAEIVCQLKEMRSVYRHRCGWQTYPNVGNCRIVYGAT